MQNRLKAARGDPKSKESLLAESTTEDKSTSFVYQNKQAIISAIIVLILLFVYWRIKKHSRLFKKNSI